jgi:hypothetical protein
MNDDSVVILQGLDADDKVYLTAPPDADKMELERIPGSTGGTAAATGADGWGRHGAQAEAHARRHGKRKN